MLMIEVYIRCLRGSQKGWYLRGDKEVGRSQRYRKKVREEGKEPETLDFTEGKGGKAHQRSEGEGQGGTEEMNLLRRMQVLHWGCSCCAYMAPSVACS